MGRNGTACIALLTINSSRNAYNAWKFHLSKFFPASLLFEIELWNEIDTFWNGNLVFIWL